MALANKRFPYTELADDQRFEDLLFDLYGSEIRSGKLAGFDSISRMTGTADLGKDCCLYRQGKQYGLIQGKKYRDLLSKPEFGREMVKFCLYALLHPELIHDPEDYSYFIAVGYGFDRHCIDFMADFNKLIKVEMALDKWIAYWLKKPAFSLLGLKDARSRLLPLLEKIKVRPIWPPNLDELLLQDRNKHLIPSYFEVRTITLNEKPKLLPAALKAELKVASSIVGIQRNEFEGIPGSHIPRQETASLYDWIMTPAKLDQQDREENICLLAANPGLGKTVVIRDLYDRLQQEDIPVLALKADEIFGQNLKTLGEQAGISLSLRDLIDQCKEHFPKVVILIDQIDALSQSLSADPNFLSTYKQLIGIYTHDSIVRVIISVRLFDLYYDPSLKIYRNVKAFELLLLDSAVVIAELAKLGITTDHISPALLELLRTPNHLDIFSRICKGPSQFAGIKTLVDLYNELWNEKIGPAANLAYEIAIQMYANQRITVSEKIFENHTAALLYLKKERLVKTDNQGLQFFHQTFYDYVFARRFVQQGASLADFLKKEKQSILSRSALKMIIGHLRPHDPLAYIMQLTGLLKSKKYHFHIQHLLISFLAVQVQPTAEEKGLIMDLILPNPDYTQVFYDQVNGADWINFLLDMGYLNQITEPATLFHVLRRNMNYSPGPLLDFIAGMKDRKNYIRLLYGLTDWNQPKALVLLDDIDHDTYGLIEHAAENMPLFVFEKVKEDFFRSHSQNNSIEQQRDTRLYEILFEKIPLELCSYAISTIDQEIPNKIIPGYQDKLDHDFFIGGLDFSDDEHISRRENFYKLFARQLKKFAADGAPIFTNWLETHRRSPYRSIIKLLVYCLHGNEHLYVDEIYELLFYLQEMEVFDEHGRLNYNIRQLFKVAYPLFNAGQQEAMLQMILNLRITNEHVKYEQNGKKTFSVWGATQLFFFQVLPEYLLAEDPRIKKRYQELLRRHGNTKERKPQVTVLRGSSAPLTNSAYLYMSDDDWIKSFRKYDRFYDRWGHKHESNSFGGMHEHADAFLKAVLGNPARHFQLVARIVSDTSIDEYYALKGLEGLANESYQIPAVLELFKAFLKRPIDKSNVIWCLNLAEKLSDRGNYDKEILNYVIGQALSGTEPDVAELKSYIQNPKNNIDRYVQAGISTIQGSAARMLVQVTDKRYADDIFKALETLMQNEVTQIKAAAIYQYAYMMNLDPKRAFTLFVDIISDPRNEDIQTCTLWSLQYLVNYNFKKLIPHLNTLIRSSDLLTEDKTWLSTILFGAWLHGYRGAEELFTEFLRKHPEAQPHAARDAIKYYYEDGKVSKKAFKTLKNIFGKKKGKGKDFYLPELDCIKLKDIYPVLELYVKAPFFELRESFIEYLIDQIPVSPIACIRLFEAAISNRKSQPEEPEFFGHEGTATKFILGAHIALGKKHLLYQEKLLDAFDKVLADARFRGNADNHLEKALS